MPTRVRNGTSISLSFADRIVLRRLMSQCARGSCQSEANMPTVRWSLERLVRWVGEARGGLERASSSESL